MSIHVAHLWHDAATDTALLLNTEGLMNPDTKDYSSARSRMVKVPNPLGSGLPKDALAFYGNFYSDESGGRMVAQLLTEYLIADTLR